MVKPAAPEAPRLSLAVITFNEEKHLPRLLEAARNFADEVVVVDSGSTDATVAIARSHGARVIESDWPGFGRQKQRALEEARGEWVLSLDADELPDAQLTESLAAVARGEGDEFDGYAMDRLTAYQGEYIRHAWSPDWVLRLVRRGRGRWTDRPVHEALVVDGSVGRLKGKLLHDSYENLADHYTRLVAYSRLSAESAYARGRRFHWSQLLLRPPAAFLRRFLLKRGFLDGVRGLLVAGATAVGAFMKYAFLYEYQRERRIEQKEGER
ncbi:MAG: glycosyltransferase family 2 protein [Acidobacteriota bacterium]|nr:glycosyltransferase family 2 protein [Acidobacteriota bacterium]